MKNASLSQAPTPEHPPRPTRLGFPPIQDTRRGEMISWDVKCCGRS